MSCVMQFEVSSEDVLTDIVDLPRQLRTAGGTLHLDPCHRKHVPVVDLRMSHGSTHRQVPKEC